MMAIRPQRAASGAGVAATGRAARFRVVTRRRLEPPHRRWTIAERESPDIAAELIQRTCCDDCVDRRGRILHSDNGKPMARREDGVDAAVARHRARALV
jgi:hypothetical protein